MKKAFILLAVILAVAGIAYSLTAKEIFNKVRERYARFEGIRVEFVQTSTDPVSGTNKSSSGTMILARPEKFRMEVTAPKKQLLVSDGTVLFVYEEGSKQATKQELGKDAQQTPLGDLLFGHDEAFTVVPDSIAIVSSERANTITLVPKEGRAPFKWAQLSIDPRNFVCRGVYYVDLSGDSNLFKLFNEKGLKKEDAKWFEFTPPPGVAVVEMK